MFENLKKIRKQNNISCKTMSELLQLKTASAYFKKENGTVPFTLMEGKIISSFFKKPIEKIFFDNELS